MLGRAKRAAAYLIPIRREEFKKFIPMFVIFFFVGFIYNILRNTKDVILITGQASGAEIIPFIKVWGVLPSAILMTALFSWLSNRFSMEKVFYIIVSIFMVYFTTFAFVIYPNSELLHLDRLGSFLGQYLPQGAAGLISMIKYWSLTLFYIMCELWSCITLSILFWGFANETTTVKEATRFYGLFGLGINFSNIAAGQACIILSRLPMKMGHGGGNSWQESLVYITMVILISGGVIFTFFRWLHVNVLKDCKFYKSRKKNNFKLSVRKNFAYLARSKYLMCIAILVLSFNLVINLVEVLWKHQLKQLFPLPNDLSVYLSQISVITGIIATAVALFSGKIINRFGWTRSALITPLIMLFASVGFFSCLLFGNSMSGWMTAYLGIAPLTLAATFGSIQVVMCRACKYTVFDATKELSFLPLTTESRKKGKAAIDGVGSRLGKSGGSVIHQGLLMIFASFAASAPIVAVFLLCVIAVWMGAIKVLGKEFKFLNEQHESLNIEEAPNEPSSSAPAQSHQAV